MVPLILGHSQAVALIEFYGKIMTRLWKAVMVFNMQPLTESLFLVNESSFLRHILLLLSPLWSQWKTHGKWVSSLQRGN